MLGSEQRPPPHTTDVASNELWSEHQWMKWIRNYIQLNAMVVRGRASGMGWWWERNISFFESNGSAFSDDEWMWKGVENKCFMASGGIESCFRIYECLWTARLRQNRWTSRAHKPWCLLCGDFRVVIKEMFWLLRHKLCDLWASQSPCADTFAYLN